MQKYFLAVALPVFVSLIMLQGCNKAPECPEVTTVVYDDVANVDTGVESYACSNTNKAPLLEQTWCEARIQFDKRGQSADSHDFPIYLKGFREGYGQASLAEDSQVSLLGVPPTEPPYDMGYRDGYFAITDAMGVFQYNCSSTDLASEYKDRWCEAAEAYRSSGVGSESNPFVKGRFIDGYMTGGRIALTVPTSMEAFFSGENPEGYQPTIVQPSGDLNSTELAFYRGFDVGYKAMLDSIRESINQVMQQMQIPNTMGIPDGVMPPPPEQ